MAGIIEIPDKPRKAPRPVLTAEDFRRIIFFREKMPAWLADRLTRYEDLGAFGPECVRLIRKVMLATGVSSGELCKRVGAHRTYASRLFGSFRLHEDSNMQKCSPKTKSLESMLSALEPEIEAACRKGPAAKVVAAPRVFGGRR